MGYLAAAWSSPTGSDAVGLDCTGAFLIQTLVIGSGCAAQESAHVILAGSWVQSRAILLKFFPQEGDFPCLLLLFSFAMKFAASVPLTDIERCGSKYKLVFILHSSRVGNALDRQKTSKKCS